MRFVPQSVFFSLSLARCCCYHFRLEFINGVIQLSAAPKNGFFVTVCQHTVQPKAIYGMKKDLLNFHNVPIFFVKKINGFASAARM